MSERVTNLVHDLYGLVDGSTSWEGVLEQAAAAGGFPAAGLVRHDFSSSESQLLGAFGYDPSLPVGVDRNPFLGEERLFFQAGATWLSSDLLPRAELEETGFWKSWLSPQGFTQWGCMVVSRKGPKLLYLELLGRGTGPTPTTRRLRQMVVLVPHLCRVMALAGLSRRTCPAPPSPLPSSVAMRTALPSSFPSTASPLYGKGGYSLQQLAALPPEARLRVLYGLTRAEVRLAMLFVHGISPSAAADRLCNSLHTIRTHLQRIFSKTECRRQAELITLLLTGPAHLGMAAETPALAKFAQPAGACDPRAALDPTV